MSSGAVPHSRRTVLNMVTLAGGHVGSTVILLAMTPYFFGVLGASKYGLLTLFFSLVQYAAVVDFGLGPGLIKYVAEDYTFGRRDGIRQMMTFAVLFYCGIGTIVMTLLLCFGREIVALVKMPADLRHEAFPLLIGICAYFIISQLSSTLHGLLSGIGRLDVSAVVRAIGLILYVLATSLALRLGYGLYGMLAASFLTLIVSVPVMYMFALREFGQMFCSPTAIRWPSVRRIFVTGGWIQLSSIMYLVYSQTNGIVIGFVISVAAVAIFDLASRLSRAIRAIAYYANAALLPAMSALEARSGTEAIHKSLVDGSRYVAAVSFCIAGFVIASAPIVFSAWLGSRAQQRGLLVEILIVLCLTAVIENYIGVANTVLRAVGKPRLETVYSVTTAVTNVILTIVLAPRFGILGVVIGTLVGSTIGSVLFLTIFCRTRHVPMFANFVKPLLKLFCVTIPAAGATAYAVSWFVRQGVPSRGLAFAELAALSCLYGAIFVVVLGITGYLRATDLTFVKRIVPSRLGVPVDRRFVRFLFAGSR
jgi:O-antigen/teichoic acid export membrane protein